MNINTANNMKKYIEPKLQIVDIKCEAMLAASVRMMRDEETDDEIDFGARGRGFGGWND